ncbi:PREDICTED: pheromone-processing carboxypeptidase KEX1-like [Camelina sativa]|uniref:Pheromone-processing carboxypeptidase KEX1-like n=1 Tax=Camelina sativa TaxID=90675 RepID=A0ABM0USE2_CAMSA|nr:PREDICTED: pheromone-processing carboxypeptidase KEX1-like [Camelina sativa]
MEHDKQIPYSRNEIKEDMEEQIYKIVIDSNLDLSNSSCGICSRIEEEFIEFDHDNDDDDDGDDHGDGDGDGDDDCDSNSDSDEVEDEEDEDEYDEEDEDDDANDDEEDDCLISTPFCSHKFCKTCWKE